MIYNLIPSRNTKRYNIINLAHGYITSEEKDYSTLDESYGYLIESHLSKLVSEHIWDYIESVLGNYIRYQSDFLTLLSEYSFRSPLNFLMVRHDYSIFIHEFLRCQTKLKFGFDFIKQSFLTNYNSQNLFDSHQSKLSIGNRFLLEKDNCKAKLGNLLDEYSHLIKADDYNCKGNTNISHCFSFTSTH